MSTQYDKVGVNYENFKAQGKLPIIEKYTFFKLLGNIQGKHILDLACGSGFYSRLLKQEGAAKLLGIDISTEMVKVARSKENNNPVGNEYQVFDVATMPHLGYFDLATAVYLLNYAQNKETLVQMLINIRRNLTDEGRFISITANPGFFINKSDLSKYGLKILKQEAFSEGYNCEIEFLTDSPFRVNVFQLHQSIYESAVMEAGFKSFSWHNMEIPPEAIKEYGEDYWQDFLENPSMIVLSCSN